MKYVLAATVVLFTYGYHSATTMPRACFTIDNAVRCQKVQLALLADMKSVDWDTVHWLRRF